MIGGQQAMFGNFASYSQQISPGGGQGIQPSYSNPMGGGGGGYASSPYAAEANIGSNLGVAGTSAVGNVGAPMLGMAAMAGSFLPGKVGGAFGMMDPTMAGMTGFGAASGLNFGGKGMLSRAGWSHLGGAASRIAGGGLSGIARAGMAGLGGAALAAAPAMAIGAGIQYAGGQMVQGAQFQNQVHGFMQSQFRHLNPQSQTGYGFSREQTGGIADMVRTMGHKDAMTGPQELLRIMKKGVGMGQFRAVQDAKEFKAKFKEMVGTLKSISEDMSTTLEGAMPFLQKSKQMGFWTPKDIQRGSQVARGAAQATGMSVAQTQAMMGQGAAMARQVGALGSTGAVGMARTMGLVGGGLRSGVISQQEMSEATGGLQGNAATQSMAGAMQAATTRFARGRTGRWLLAALGGKGFQGFNQANLQKLMAGNLSIGQIGRMARRNIAKQGAFNFVQNERDLRGQLLKQGPGAQLGLIRGLIGNRLYGTGAKDKYMTKRLMKRYFGVGGRQADILAKLARSAPEIMEDNKRRSAAILDQQERSRDEMMNNSYEGLKRKAAGWWDKNVKDPLQKFGADMSRQVSSWWESTTDKIWGRSGRGFKPRGIDAAGAAAMRDFALGDKQKMQDVFGKRGNISRLLGGEEGGGRGPRMSIAGLAMGTNRGLLARAANVLSPGGGQFFGDITQKEFALGKIGVNIRGLTGKARSDAERQGRLQLMASQRGIAGVTDEAAKALGMDSGKGARAAMRAAQVEMGKGSFIRAMQGFQKGNEANRSWWQKVTGGGKDEGNLAASRQMVQQIRAGKVGGEALRKLVAGGTVGQAAMRLAAAQSREQRESTVGIKTDAAAGLLGMDTGGIAERMEKLQEFTTKQAGVLAVLTGGVKGGATGIIDRQKSIMQLFKGPSAARFRKALTLMAKTRADGSPDPKARAAARDVLSRMSTNKDLTDEQRDVLTKMADPNDPSSKHIGAIAGQMGKAVMGGRRLAAQDVVRRRMNRLKEGLDDDKEDLVKKRS
jgi:hypothetical protein